MNAARFQYFSLGLKLCFLYLFILCTLFPAEALPRRGIPTRPRLGWRGLQKNQTNLNGTRIDLVCSKAPFYKLCIKTLTTDPPHATGADTATLIVTAIKSTMAKARQTSLLIGSRLSLKNNNEARYGRAYGVCRTRYSDAAGKLSNSLRNAQEGSDRSSVKKLVLSAMKDIVSCQNIFNMNGIVQSPLSQNNKRLLKMCKNNLVILDASASM